jgi:hypothetical protein
MIVSNELGSMWKEESVVFLPDTSPAIAWSCFGKWRRTSFRRFGVPSEIQNRVPQEKTNQKL